METSALMCGENLRDQTPQKCVHWLYLFCNMFLNKLFWYVSYMI